MPGRELPDPTRDRLLDAALAVVARRGLARLSLDAVARAAGLSRQTVYRHFGSRDGLVTAVILREEEAFLTLVRDAAARHGDPRPAMEAALAAGLRAARDHPLLDRLLRDEPAALLPYLTTSGGPVLSAARPAIEDLLAERLPHLSPSQVQRAAEATTRLFISFAVNPPDDPVEEVAAGLADLILNGLKGPAQ
jgi:AcrR family transcriptional regulator